MNHLVVCELQPKEGHPLHSLKKLTDLVPLAPTGRGAQG